VTRRLTVACVISAAAWLACGPASAAAADGAHVRVQFADFAPGQVDVLPGETVSWENVSERRHTVVADDGSFASGDLFGGGLFAHTFAAAGTIPYHCTVHPAMVGEVDVRTVTLGPLPVAPVPVGEEVRFTGRTADPGAPVGLERNAGAGYTPVAVASPSPDGTWSATLAVTATGDYRATGPAGASQTRRVLVADRRVLLRRTGRGVAVTVTPALPYGRAVLQQVRRERFGWWPVRAATLDYVSRTSFRVRPPARVRVVLVARDGWTPLATSRVLVLGHPRDPPAITPVPGHHG
jgi:plastocyanin